MRSDMVRFRAGQRTVRRQAAEIEPEEILMDAANIPGFRLEMHEGRIERPIGRGSLLAFAGLLAVGLSVLAGRLVELQLIRGGAFFAEAQANRTYPIFIQAPRGIFYDRYGEPLVGRAPTFAISLQPRALPSDADFARVLSEVAGLVGKTVSEIAEANGILPEAMAGGVRRDLWPPEVFVASGELREAVLEIQSRPQDFPGAIVAEGARRTYLLGSAAAHLVGYVGRPSREDLARNAEVRPGELVGKDGLELWYESALRGRPGQKLIEVNAAGEAQRERFVLKPSPGRDVALEVDAHLQRFAAATLTRHIRALDKRAGALVALDPRDGAVRAAVSFPAYDPNEFGRGMSQAALARLLEDPDHPFFNRVLSGGYPSGSTIKPLLATAALEERVIDPGREIYDPGYLSVPNPYDPARPSIFKDWRALGWVDMRRAIAMSANVYFYIIGGGYRDIGGLGITRIRQWLGRFGWGAPTGVDLPGEYGGFLPDPASKPITRPYDPVWRLGDTYITAIGQGDLQVTPLQLAASIAAVANGGTLWKPRVVRAVMDEAGRTVEEVPPVKLGERIAGLESLAVVREGMREAVTSGSARALADLPVAVAGKTGTAETGVYGKNHGWFVGFAPYDDPELVIAVLVEEGTGGSTDAVPIAREVLYDYVTHRRSFDVR